MGTVTLEGNCRDLIAELLCTSKKKKRCGEFTSYWPHIIHCVFDRWAWTQNTLSHLLAAIWKKKKKEKHFCTCVWADVKENIEPTQQWGLTTAESSGSSIIQLPQWPSQKASWHHKPTRERQKVKPKAICGIGQYKPLSATLKTENTFWAAVSGRFHVWISLIRARLDSICNLGHARKCQGLLLPVPPLSFLANVLSFRGTNQTVSVEKL